MNELREGGRREERRRAPAAASSLRTVPSFPRRCRKWANRRGRTERGVFSGPIEGLPELIDACGGKESVFAAIVGQELHHSQVSQVGSRLAEFVAGNHWKERNM